MLFKTNLIKDETSLGLLINLSSFSKLFKTLGKKVYNWGKMLLTSMRFMLMSVRFKTDKLAP